MGYPVGKKVNTPKDTSDFLTFFGGFYFVSVFCFKKVH